MSDTIERVSNGHAVIVDVRFKTSKKVYTFEIDDMDIELGTAVVAESEMGLCLGHVVGLRHRTDRPEQPLKKVIRIATEEDIETDRKNRPFEEEAKAFCIERVKSRNLPMKVVATETTLDRKRLIFYFTADGRIDFRELVRDLAAKFKTRIEMRQIGVRDEVKIMGSIGACGRVTCCSSFLTTFEPISIKMAKQQELALSQSKLSGICGRLMCCIAYEYEGSAERDIPTITEDSYAETSQLSEPEKALAEELKKPVSCHEVCPVMRQETIEEQLKEEMGKEEKKGSHRKRHSHKKVQKKKDKGRPFSKRKRFLEKKKH